jgi:hypothetical protein
MPRALPAAARRFLRRRRRPIAAVLAGVGALLALTTLRAAPAPVTADLPLSPGNAVSPGEVVVPVVLASGAVASVLAVGDVVDILGFSDSDPPTAAVIAREARVFDLPTNSSFAGPSSTVVLMAVPEGDALPVSAASVGGGVGVVLRGH